MSLKKMQKEYRETPKNEIIQSVLENALYGEVKDVSDCNLNK